MTTGGWHPTHLFDAMPLVGVVLTLGAYWVAHRIHERTGRAAWSTPVLIAISGLGLVLWLSDTSYDDYFASAASIHYALGPIVVLLAVPLYRQVDRIRKSGLLIALTMLVGSSVAIGTGIIIAQALGASFHVTLALASRSATAPIAIGIADRLGGVASLGAVVAIMTGIVGAVIGPSILRLMHIRDSRAAGLALGIASHGIGTAAAFRLTEVAGVFASIGMILNAILTALLLPILFAAG